MKKSYFLLGVIILILLVAVILRLSSNEDSWICENGEWQKHGYPRDAKPNRACVGEPEKQIKFNEPEFQATSSELEAQATFSENALISNPKINELISSPLQIQGQVTGPWFFEGVLPIRLEDRSGNIIAAGQAIAEGEWMTPKPVKFTANLVFSLASTTETSGYLVISKDNPSDLPENNGSIKIPVRFK